MERLEIGQLLKPCLDEAEFMILVIDLKELDRI
jgi:hypothetical protein